MIRRVGELEASRAAATRGKSIAEQSNRVLEELEAIAAGGAPLTAEDIAHQVTAARARFDAERLAPEPASWVMRELQKLSRVPQARSFRTADEYAAAVEADLLAFAAPASNAGGTAAGRPEGADR